MVTAESFGVVRESWHFQETPHGPLLIGVTEAEGELGASPVSGS